MYTFHVASHDHHPTRTLPQPTPTRGRDLGAGGDAGGVPYAAAALSLVLHSANPHLPTFRSDVRYFECAVRPFAWLLLVFWCGMLVGRGVGAMVILMKILTIAVICHGPRRARAGSAAGRT